MSDSIEYVTSPQLFGFPGRTKSTVWNDFGFYIGENGKLDKTRAICRICHTGVKYSGNTTNLHTHLTKHYKSPNNSVTSCTTPGVSSKSRSSDTKIKIEARWGGSSVATSDETTDTTVVSSCVQKDMKPVIAEVFSNCSRVESLSAAIGEFLIGNMLPLSVVESPTFLQLMATADIHFSVPSKSYYVDEFVSQRHELLRLTPIDLVRNSEAVALTHENWKLHVVSGKTYVTHSVSLVKDDWSFETFVLSTEVYSGSNTEDDIRNIASQWELPAKPIVITDQVPLIGNANNSIGFSAVFCLGKAISSAWNLVMESGDVQEMLSSVHELDFQVKDQNSDDGQMDASFSVLKGLRDFKIIAGLAENKDGSGNKKANTLQNRIEDVYSVLRPLKAAIDMMCEQKFLTASIILPILRKLEISLIENTKGSEFTKGLKSSVWAILSENYKKRQVRDFLLIASLLDPRFKDLLFVKGPERLHAREVMSVVASDLYRNVNSKQEEVTYEGDGNTYSVVFVSDDDDEEPVPKKTKQENSNVRTEGVITEANPKSEDWLADVVGKTVSDERDVAKEDNVMAEVDYYLTMQQTASPPFQWWANREVLYPTLSRVAKRFLCAPAMSVPAERLFGVKISDDILRRRILPDELLNEYIFLNSNYSKLGDFNKTI